jgi:hypothetical protein
MPHATTPAALEHFTRSVQKFTAVLSWLGSTEADQISHGELEAQITDQCRDVMNQMMQDRMDLGALRETRCVDEVIDTDGVEHRNVETGHARTLTTVFGKVTVTRIAYRAPGASNLHPADAVLNLPTEKHSHGLRRLAAVESARGSFDDAVDAVGRATGVLVGKRQLQDLAVRAASDFDTFYQQRQAPPADDTHILGLSFDATGIVVRPEALREATAKAATADPHPTGARRHRKRMAEIAAVFDIAPAVRTPADVMPAPGTSAPSGPRTTNKWLAASITATTADVITDGFDEATRRDPTHQRTWIALVDGNNHQIERIRAEARARRVTVTIVIDFIHVVEYLWAAARCFYPDQPREAQAWVRGHARDVLAGRASTVAAAITRKATYNNLTGTQREPADTAATYLLNKKPYLDYPTALTSGWPIATGVIEGACRHLVADRMDITGARWGLDRAEAVLKLRAITTNGDFDAYWAYHLQQERQRVHHTRYLGGVIPT